MSPVDKPRSAIKVFYSYAHKDEKLRDKLEVQLALLKRQGYIASWHDRMIRPGVEWEKEINRHLQAADIILLLVSPDFIASDYCYSVEIEQAMQKHRAGRVRVVPVILRPVNWSETPFGTLQALPTDGKPITSRNWHNQDEAFFVVAEGLRKLVEEVILSRSLPEKLHGQMEKPLLDSHFDEVEYVVRERAPERDKEQLLVLIIDDEANIVEFIKLGLRYEGFQVEGAFSGEEGVVLAQQMKPDFIILDMLLSDIDGYEVLSRLRTRRETRDIPVVFLTSRDNVQDRISGLNAGADDYLTKPFAFEELVARIRAVLRRRGHENSENLAGSKLEASDEHRSGISKNE